jgi:hypothetical protein
MIDLPSLLRTGAFARMLLLLVRRRSLARRRAFHRLRGICTTSRLLPIAGSHCPGFSLMCILRGGSLCSLDHSNGNAADRRQSSLA